MGNICCGYDEEDYKRGIWYNPDDDDDANVETENPNGSSFIAEYDDAQYNPEAIDREQKILLHEKTRISAVENEDEEEDNAAIGVGDQRTNGRTRLKRPSITSTPIEVSSSFTPPSFPKSPETTEFLLTTLAHHFVFDSIDEETKLQFVSAMQSQEFNEGDWVLHQGDEGDYFYIVKEGEVAFHVGEGLPVGSPSEHFPQVGIGSKGATFGELALLYNTPRAASIRALAPLELYKIDQLTFRSLLMLRRMRDRSGVISLVKKLLVFQDLDEAKLRKLVDAFTILEFDEGERIVNKGDHGDVLYILKSGMAKIDNIGHGASKFQDQIVGEGGCFGERALITGETRAANVTALKQSTLLAISKRVFEDIIGPLEQAVMSSSLSKYLKSIPSFEFLKQDEIDRCVMHLKEESFEKGDKISARGKLYLIQEGHALMMLHEEGKKGVKRENVNGGNLKKKEMMAGPKLVKLEKGDYFGDLWGSRVRENGGIPQALPAADKRNENLIVNVESTLKCLTLQDSVVRRVIGDCGCDSIGTVAGEEQGNESPERSRFSRIMSMQSKTYFDFIKSARSMKSNTNCNVLNLSKLKKHRILGVGTFGKVWLVTPKANSKDKPTPYALKMISKRQLLHQKLTVSVLREKNVMESIEHPFLLHMVSSFQDENYLYLLMDLVLGGELFELLYSNGKKGKNDNAAWTESAFYKSFGAVGEEPIKDLVGLGVRKAVFYGACVIDAFAYLHNRRVVYRDLKPENILLNQNGYCTVVDFGFAKVVLDKTYTMCGTLEYLAPEVVVNKGHNHAADYWSFGCLSYELIVGQTPFFQAGLDQMSLLKKIAKAQYTFPEEIAKLSSATSKGLDVAFCHWKDVVSRLLKPNAVERLGNLRNGVEDILDHDFFANIDFNEFRRQIIPAPWIPTIADPLDASHFGSDFSRQEKPEVFARKISPKDQLEFRGF